MKKIVVIGGGESGFGSAVLAKTKGMEVFVSDFGRIADKYRQRLADEGIPFEEGGHTLERILTADEVVKSPGVPDTAPVIRRLRERGIPVISEIEFAGRYTDGARTICITGSNGKTTTTTLIYRLLAGAGYDVCLGGNIGQSFALSVAAGRHDWYVLELSSFQLDGMSRFRADIGVLMNITPDHLDRYEYSMERYAASKMQIIRNQRADDRFIYCADDPVIASQLPLHQLPMSLLPFTAEGERSLAAEGERPLAAEVEGVRRGTQAAADGANDRQANPGGGDSAPGAAASGACGGLQGACAEGGDIVAGVDGRVFRIPVGRLRIRGRHNMYNAMAATLAAMAAGVPEESIRTTLEGFAGIEHRLEPAGEYDGVEWINDSKATNVDSVWYALDSMARPTVWIAGGTDKGNDYGPLIELARSRVKTLVCMGVDNRKLVESFTGVVPEVIDTHTFADAMAAAERAAAAGDTVLLSPACASFDLFSNYEDRGRQFKEWVEQHKR